jgi:hypothetical protein
VERFKRTFQRLLEKEIKMNGKKPLKDLIPNALDLYNRYLNHRDIATFFRRDLKKHQNWQKRIKLEGTKKYVKRDTPRFFPAMMLLPGVEEEYIKYMKQKTAEVDAYYQHKFDHLKPGSLVQYYNRNDDPFGKSRGSTQSKAVELIGRHTYGSAQKQGASFVVSGTTQRYLPYELEPVDPPSTYKKLSRNKKSGYQVKKTILI